MLTPAITLDNSTTEGIEMKATLSADKKTLTIELSVNEKPLASESGKTLVLASTHGFIPAQVGGQIAKIGVNVVIPNPAYVKPAK